MIISTFENRLSVILRKSLIAAPVGLVTTPILVGRYGMGFLWASSNKPSLVVVTESPTSDERKKKIFDFIDSLLQKTGKIGEYDQKI